jgi:hypothetical protein
MKTFILSIFLILFIENHYCFAREKSVKGTTNISAAYNVLFYQSVYGMEDTFGAEFAAGRKFGDHFMAQTGIRLGINPVRPEFFVRLNGSQNFGAWTPAIGLETGISNRMYFDSDTELLEETREAMLNDPGHTYLSSHTELLSFRLKPSWNISAIETDFGTHFRKFGRTLRFQVTLLRIGITF